MTEYMQAILKESFAIKTLQAVQAQHGPVDLGMLERSAHALELLGRLVDSGVDLVFKGGTSLILRLQTIRRLSIDVDIICNWPREKLDPVLREIGRKPPFLDFEEHVRRKDSLPARRHYKFYFKSVVDGNRLPILLDVLEDTFNVSLAFCRHGLAKDRDTDVDPCRLLEDGKSSWGRVWTCDIRLTGSCHQLPEPRLVPLPVFAKLNSAVPLAA